MDYYSKSGQLLSVEEVEVGRYVFESDGNGREFAEFLGEFYDSAGCECCDVSPTASFIQVKIPKRDFMWGRSVMLPDGLRKVWIIFVESRKVKRGEQKLKWDYPALQVTVRVHKLSKLKRMKVERPFAYKQILRDLEKKVLTPKRIAKFKSGHKLRKEAMLIEDVDWRTILKEALTGPGVRSPKYDVLWPFSFKNQQLLLYQMRERGITPGPVKTVKFWKTSFGTNIAKGEKGLYSVVPDLPRGSKQSLDDILQGEEEADPFVTKFRLLAYFFAYSQTEKGKREGGVPDLPKMPDFDPELAMEKLGIEVIPFQEQRVFKDTIGHFTAGFSRASGKEEVLGEFAIRPGIPGAINTFFHELGHILLSHNHADYDYVNRRGEAELEAESVSLLCMSALGLSNGEDAAAYIQGWYAGEDYPEGSAEKVMNAASRILKAGIPKPADAPLLKESAPSPLDVVVILPKEDVFRFTSSSSRPVVQTPVEKRRLSVIAAAHVIEMLEEDKPVE